MIHHVALEVRVGDVASEASFWDAIGFRAVRVPEALGDGYTWFEREGRQIHLMHVEQPAVPHRGHVALVTPDFDAALERLDTLGIKIRPGCELWGAKRAKATSPGGHTVELMAVAPPAGKG